MGLRHGARAGLLRVVRPSTWRQWARVANFLGYDGAELREASVGAGARISPTVSVRNGRRVSVGAGAQIGASCSLWAGDSTGRIVIGDHALFAPDVFVTASNYDFDAVPGPVMAAPKREADVTIGANTWLGARVVVLPGVSIGDGSVVAAGSVVTKDLPPGVLAAGVPARVIRKRGEQR
ncbi:acyltransferase [Xylanimonas ulmi]|uniref:Acetyltransferase-like isoleucine patch superfamily enzyme n=1 Tax=Xylanimonas ulmi TaxID=228973 RepID=A0A4Q7M4K4_9MICO|nr:DapH/DapD/GlmU-related protein [Xylanibacterium ulmi]RZS61857.1 acetyltransferase-like isoleucine patch superfamily enzyme [Xylanibacterium ulmi]